MGRGNSAPPTGLAGETGGEGRGEHGTVAVGGLHLGTPLMETTGRGDRCEGRQMERAEGGMGATVEGAGR